MDSQKKGNPSELDSLAAKVQRGLGETGNTPVFISLLFVALFRAVNNVSQNLENTMGLSQWVGSPKADRPPIYAYFFVFFGGHYDA